MSLVGSKVVASAWAQATAQQLGVFANNNDAFVTVDFVALLAAMRSKVPAVLLAISMALMLILEPVIRGADGHNVDSHGGSTTDDSHGSL